MSPAGRSDLLSLVPDQSKSSRGRAAGGAAPAGAGGSRAADAPPRRLLLRRRSGAGQRLACFQLPNPSCCFPLYLQVLDGVAAGATGWLDINGATVRACPAGSLAPTPEGLAAASPALPPSPAAPAPSSPPAGTQAAVQAAPGPAGSPPAPASQPPPPVCQPAGQACARATDCCQYDERGRLLTGSQAATVSILRRTRCIGGTGGAASGVCVPPPTSRGSAPAPPSPAPTQP